MSHDSEYTAHPSTFDKRFDDLDEILEPFTDEKAFEFLEMLEESLQTSMPRPGLSRAMQSLIRRKPVYRIKANSRRRHQESGSHRLSFQFNC